jgi:hypothetical protein
MRLAAVLVALYAAFAFALFVFMHTGPRAVAACGDEGSYRTGTVSFWPPGTECAGPAPPPSTVIVLNVGYIGVLTFATIVFAAVGLIAGARINQSRVCAAAAADPARTPGAGAG